MPLFRGEKAVTAEKGRTCSFVPLFGREKGFTAEQELVPLCLGSKREKCSLLSKNMFLCAFLRRTEAWYSTVHRNKRLSPPPHPHLEQRNKGIVASTMFLCSFVP